MSIQKHLLFLLFSACTANFLTCQTASFPIENQRGAWLVHNSTVRWSSRWFVLSDIQERRHLLPQKQQHIFLARTRMMRDLKHGWNGGLGLGHFWLDPNNPSAEPRLTVPEWRICLEFNQKQSLAPNWTMHQRLLLEQRFIRKSNAAGLLDGFTQPGRFRWRIGVDRSLNRLKINGLPMQIRFSNELLIQLWNRPSINLFDHNRLTADLLFPLTKNLSVQLGYLNWYQQLASPLIYNRHVWRVSVNQQFKILPKAAYKAPKF